MTPGTDKNKVSRAISSVRESRRELIERFHLQLSDEQLEESFGGWVLPAHLLANGTINSYELSRALEQIQEDIEQQSGQTVTVLLEP
jgi:hypothetical protein